LAGRSRSLSRRPFVWLTLNSECACDVSRRLISLSLSPIHEAKILDSPGWYNPKKEKFEDLDHELGEFQLFNTLFSSFSSTFRP
jgi:hypothetical protein